MSRCLTDTNVLGCRGQEWNQVATDLLEYTLTTLPRPPLKDQCAPLPHSPYEYCQNLLQEQILGNCRGRRGWISEIQKPESIRIFFHNRNQYPGSLNLNPDDTNPTVVTPTGSTIEG